MEQSEERLLKYRAWLSKNPAWAQILSEAEGLPAEDRLYLSVWIPTLLAFTEWVLEEAQKDGKKRLYFLARDAYPVYLAASAICERRGIPIECRYLMVSRYSVRQPEYYLLGADCVERICIGGLGVTLELILRRGGLTGQEVLEVARSLGLSDELHRELLYPEILALKPRLAENQLFLSYVEEHSQKVFPYAMGYLEQEGLLDDVPYALVDSGWIGTIQQSVEQLLRQKKPELRMKGYYFGLYELPGGASLDQYECFYFSPVGGLRAKTHFSNCLFEAVFSAAAGMTVGYDYVDGRYVPRERDEINPNSWRLNRNNELLETVLKSNDGLRADRALCGRLLTWSMGNPTLWEAECMGCYLFCDDMMESRVQDAAARLSGEEIKNLHLLRRLLIFAGVRSGEVHESAWIEGSIVLNRRHVRVELLHARCYKYVVYLRKLWRNRGLLRNRSGRS